ncbi:MAG TPA: glycosyltransferase [Ignavibacteria bacterium]
MKIKLSFCIPTYNRTHLIEISINSILSSIKNYSNNLNYNFELIIIDNNSTDSTEEVINKFIILNRTVNIKIIYIKNSINIGASKNFINSSKYANGDYIWFFSDDDYMIESAVSNFFKIISANYTFIFVTRLLADNELIIIKKHKPQPNINEWDAIYSSGFLMIKKMGLEITSVLGFYSSIIIIKEIWESSKMAINDNSEFGYLKILLAAINNKSCFIIKEPGVICRLNYRGFKDKDSIVWLDEYIATFLFAKNIGYDEKTCNEMIESIFKSHSKLFVIDKAKGVRRGNLFNTKNKLGYQGKYYDKWFLISLIPQFILRPIYRVLYRFYKRK